MGFTTAGNGSPQILEACRLNLNNILFYHNSGTSTILNLLKFLQQRTLSSWQGETIIEFAFGIQHVIPLSISPALGHHRGLQPHQYPCSLQWSFFAPHFNKR
jgi:hypothetical protein